MCMKCGKPITQETVTRSSTCDYCGSDLHSCVNCTFYAPGSHYDCHESVDELVRDKDKANFCGFFAVKRAPGSSGGSAGVQNEKAAKARDAFAALFG